MGLTGIAGFNTLLYIGLHYTTSINASLVNTQLLQSLSLYFLILLLIESINKNQIGGIILSFIRSIINLFTRLVRCISDFIF
ncbi:hypothetical protein KHA80_08135 [Anaerobacillus sp. HL2]|nr:hypothetical protein KHA80_08135 [Anaerobacillus sp. HL2]